MKKIWKYTLWVLTRATLWPITLGWFAWYYVSSVMQYKRQGEVDAYKFARDDTRYLWRLGMSIEKQFLKTGEGLF